MNKPDNEPTKPAPTAANGARIVPNPQRVAMPGSAETPALQAESNLIKPVPEPGAPACSRLTASPAPEPSEPPATGISSIRHSEFVIASARSTCTATPSTPIGPMSPISPIPENPTESNQIKPYP